MVNLTALLDSLASDVLVSAAYFLAELTAKININNRSIRYTWMQTHTENCMNGVETHCHPVEPVPVFKQVLKLVGFTPTGLDYFHTGMEDGDQLGNAPALATDHDFPILALLGMQHMLAVMDVSFRYHTYTCVHNAQTQRKIKARVHGLVDHFLK